MGAAAIEHVSAEQEYSEVQSRLEAIGQEAVGLPDRMRAALIEGEDEQYRTLRARHEAIPREQYALQVRAVKLQIEVREGRLAALQPEMEAREQELREADERRVAAIRAYNEASERYRQVLAEVKGLRRDIDQLREQQLPALLARAGR